MRLLMLLNVRTTTAAGRQRAAACAPAVAAYHQSLRAAGILLDAALLQTGTGLKLPVMPIRPSSKPGPENHNATLAYALIQVRDLDEGLEWARRHPASLQTVPGLEIELWPLMELDQRDAQTLPGNAAHAACLPQGNVRRH